MQIRAKQSNKTKNKSINIIGGKYIIKHANLNSNICSVRMIAFAAATISAIS